MALAPGFSLGPEMAPGFFSGFNPFTDPLTLSNQLASTVGYPANAAANPALAAAAGAAPSASGGLGQMLQGIQAPTAPQPIFGAAAGGQSVPAPNVNAQLPLAVSQALKLLPGANRPGLPTLGQLMRGTV